MYLLVPTNQKMSPRPYYVGVRRWYIFSNTVTNSMYLTHYAKKFTKTKNTICAFSACMKLLQNYNLLYSQ